MYKLLHNKTNSNYFIINMKLKFPESSDNQIIAAEVYFFLK